jgi:hypothetical protein
MKKLFTLLMAMACVTMSFAQLNEYQVVNVPDNNEQLRSDWFGWYQTSQTVFVLPAESEYLLRIPAGSFSGSITQVKFYHIAGENITGWANEPGSDQPPFDNETYTIKIYTNVQWSQVTYIGDDSQEHTYDTIAPGTPVWTMNYSPTEVGVQNVTLSTPFEITSAMGDVCVAIYAPDMSAMGLCNTDEECAHLNFLNENDGNGWWHPQFGNANTGYNHKPYFLGVYYEDGSSYQPKCDFRVGIHNPEDESTYPDNVDELFVDNYTDSLALAFEMGNYGPDDAYGVLTLTCYVEYNGVETEIFQDPTYDLSEITTNGYLPVNYGFWNASYGNILSLLRSEEDPDEPSQFEEIGLGWPFQLCIHADFQSTNGAIDPNMENNTYCVTVHNVDAESGINEVANSTLNVTPNPASTEVMIENAAGAQIFVYNIAGQEVMSIASAEANETLNVSNLNAGLYIIRVVNGNEVSTAKVSIVR